MHPNLEPPKGAFDGNSKHNSSGILDQTFGGDPTSCFLNVSFGPGQAYQIPLPVGSLSSINQIVATASGKHIQVPDSGRSLPLAPSSFKSKYANVLSTNPSAHDVSKDSTKDFRKDTLGLIQTILVESSEDESETETPSPNVETDKSEKDAVPKKDDQIKIFSIKESPDGDLTEQAMSNYAGTEENRSSKVKITDRDLTIFSEQGSSITATPDKEQSNLN